MSLAPPNKISLLDFRYEVIFSFAALYIDTSVQIRVSELLPWVPWDF